MKPSLPPMLNRLLDEAAQLTKTGKLAGATAAIQRALGGTPEHDLPKAPDARGSVPPTSPPAPRRGGLLGGLVRELTGREAGRADAPRAKLDRTRADQPRTDRPATEFISAEFAGEFGSRQYKLFVPAGSARTPRPLIVMLHGCTQDPDDFAAGTRMNQLARQHGFLVLYPAQAPRSNTQKCWNWFQPADQRRGSGEPALLAAMTRHIMTTHAIDPARVYAAGLSAGGAMAAILGAEYTDVFAAVGVHSGLPPGAAHDIASAFMVMLSGHANPAPAGGAPVIVFHGDKDHTVHPSNGAHLVSSLSEAGIGSKQRGDAGREFTRTVYRSAEGMVHAEHWLVHGAGHAWSGGDSAGSFTDASGPNASAEMVRFFLAHPRVSAK